MKAKISSIIYYSFIILFGLLELNTICNNLNVNVSLPEIFKSQPVYAVNTDGKVSGEISWFGWNAYPDQHVCAANTRVYPINTKLLISYKGKSLIVTVKSHFGNYRGRIVDLKKQTFAYFCNTGQGVFYGTVERVK